MTSIDNDQKINCPSCGTSCMKTWKECPICFTELNGAANSSSISSPSRSAEEPAASAPPEVEGFDFDVSRLQTPAKKQPPPKPEAPQPAAVEEKPIPKPPEPPPEPPKPEKKPSPFAADPDATPFAFDDFQPPTPGDTQQPTEENSSSTEPVEIKSQKESKPQNKTTEKKSSLPESLFGDATTFPEEVTDSRKNSGGPFPPDSEAEKTPTSSFSEHASGFDDGLGDSLADPPASGSILNLDEDSIDEEYEAPSQLDIEANEDQVLARSGTHKMPVDSLRRSAAARAKPKKIEEEEEEPLARLLKQYGWILATGAFCVVLVIVGSIWLVTSSNSEPELAENNVPEEGSEETPTQPVDDPEQEPKTVDNPDDNEPSKVIDDPPEKTPPEKDPPEKTPPKKDPPVDPMPMPEPPKTEVATLVGTLTSGNSRDADRARDALVERGAEVVPELMKHLNVNNEKACLQIAAVVTRLGPAAKAAAPEMANVLVNGPFKAKEKAAEALLSIGKPAAEELGKVLSTGSNALSRMYASEYLTKLGSDAAPAAKYLAKGLSDSNGTTADNSEEALKLIGHSALAELTPLLKSASTSTRLRICEILATFRVDAQPALPALHEVLNGSSTSEELRQAAAEVMVGIGKSAIDPLIESLDHERSAVRNIAASTLSKIGPTAIDPLTEVLTSKEKSDATRIAATLALEKMGRDALKAVPTLEKVAQQGGDLQTYCQSAIQKIRGN